MTGARHWEPDLFVVQDRAAALTRAASLDIQRRRIPFVMASVVTTLLVAVLENPQIAEPCYGYLVLVLGPAAVGVWWIANWLEQREVRPEPGLLARDLEQPRRARVAVLVDVVAEARHERTGLAPAAYDVEGDGVPARLVDGELVEGGDHLVQEPPAVLGDPEEPGATAEQSCGERERVAADMARA